MQLIDGMYQMDGTDIDRTFHTNKKYIPSQHLMECSPKLNIYRYRSTSRDTRKGKKRTNNKSPKKLLHLIRSPWTKAGLHQQKKKQQKAYDLIETEQRYAR